MLLSMLVAAMLGQPLLEPVASAIASPARPTVEANLADSLRALPSSGASARGSALSDDGGSGGDTPILPDHSIGLAALLPTETAFAFQSGVDPGQRRPVANQARAPPAA
jgi:hypothetical protein